MADYADADDAPRQSTAALDEAHSRAMRRFDAVANPQQEMRAQALEARRFVNIQGAMWEGAWGTQWENAPRPEIDMISPAMRKIETDYRENRLTVDYVPADDIADAKTADTLDGMYRADAYEYRASEGYDNGFIEGLQGGFGAWRLTTIAADPDDPDNEQQRINPGVPIVDADQCVYFDPASKRYDKADAKWCFVIAAVPRETAVDEWGDDNIAPWPVRHWKYGWDWYTPDVVQIAEYYEVQKVDDIRVTLTNKFSGDVVNMWLSDGDKDDIALMVKQGWTKKTKPLKRSRVRKYIMNGTKILKDCGYIAGDMIPVVPFYGTRVWVDNMERFFGHVTKSMDKQRVWNTSVAKLVEIQSMAPYEVPIVAPEQIMGMIGDKTIAEHWAVGNIERHPFRVLNPLRNEDGSIAAAGPIGQITPPQVPPATAAIMQIMSSLFSDDAQNVDEVKANTSADAMDIAASRVDAKSAIYLDNMRLSMQRTAEIYLAMARCVYFEDDRTVDTVSRDGEQGTARLYDAQIGDDGAFRIANDLQRGKYKVVADVQEATTTKRQRAVRESLELAQVAMAAQAPQIAQAAIITAVMNQDGEGTQDMQDYARKQGVAIGLVKPTPEEEQKMQQEAQAQGQGQPSPADMALQSQATQLQSQAQLNAAKAVDTLAAARLKDAQAEAIGGPVSEPDKPSGLESPHPAQVADQEASARLKNAQAEKIHHDIGQARIMTGHKIEMDRRAADQAERPN